MSFKIKGQKMTHPKEMPKHLKAHKSRTAYMTSCSGRTLCAVKENSILSSFNQRVRYVYAFLRIHVPRISININIFNMLHSMLVTILSLKRPYYIWILVIARSTQGRKNKMVEQW